jgi:hypothetical protein
MVVERARALVLVVGITTLGVACSSTDELDPLDREIVRELMLASGSARGDERSGVWSFHFQGGYCDCPPLEIDGQTVDPCWLVSFTDLEFLVVEGSGVLGFPTTTAPGFGLLAGAIEDDGSFDVGGIHDLSALVGELVVIRRMEGRFLDDLSAQGWAGRRLLGEPAGHVIDCRWTGDFVASRN